jgi:hypothetical protein
MVIIDIEMHGSGFDGVTDDTRSSITTSAMEKGVLGVLEDPVQDVQTAAQQTLIIFMKYGEIEYPAVLPVFLPLLCTR